MKRSLLATVAAVTLLTGTGLATAQNSPNSQGSQQGSQSAPSAQPGRSGGGEMNRGAQGGGETRGSAEGRSGAQSSTGADTPGDGRARTGQTAPAGSDRSQAQDTRQAPANSNAQGQNRRDGDTAQGDQRNRNSTQERGQQDRNQPSTAQDRNPRDQSAQGSRSGGRSGSVNLTSDQRTKIRTTVVQSGNAPKVSRSTINFNISVGTVVPRSVRFAAVPAALIEIHPEWRGYSYFIVDDEIIIVEADTLRIVAVFSV